MSDLQRLIEQIRGLPERELRDVCWAAKARLLEHEWAPAARGMDGDMLRGWAYLFRSWAEDPSPLLDDMETVIRMLGDDPLLDTGAVMAALASEVEREMSRRRLTLPGPRPGAANRPRRDD